MASTATASVPVAPAASIPTAAMAVPSHEGGALSTPAHPGHAGYSSLSQSHSHHHPIPAPATPQVSPGSSPSTTPAKRSGSDSERVVKRRSLPYPHPNASYRATPSPTIEGGFNLAAVSGPSNHQGAVLSHAQPAQHSLLQMHHHRSHSHAHSNSLSSSHSHYSHQSHLPRSHYHPLSRSHSHSSHPHADPTELETQRQFVEPIVAAGPYEGLVEASDLAAPHQSWRGHSITSANRQPTDFVSERNETMSMSTLTGSSATMSSAELQRAQPARNRNTFIETPTETRAAPPRFPRGLDDEAIYSDLSVLGFPMPPSRPDHRTPERLADAVDDWGLLTELGPVSRRELLSVGGGGENRAPNDEEREIQEGREQGAPDDTETAEPDAPAVAADARAEQTHAPETAPVAPRMRTRDRAFIQQQLRFQQIQERRAREGTSHRLQLPVPLAPQTEAADPTPERQLRPLLLSSAAGPPRPHGPSDAETVARLQEMRSRLRDAWVTGRSPMNTPHPNRFTRGTQADQAAAFARLLQAGPSSTAPPATPTQATPTSARHPPDLRTPVPQQERNIAVRNWRDGVAQHSPTAAVEPPWTDPQPTATTPDTPRVMGIRSATAHTDLHERLRERSPPSAEPQERLYQRRFSRQILPDPIIQPGLSATMADSDPPTGAPEPVNMNPLGSDLMALWSGVGPERQRERRDTHEGERLWYSNWRRDAPGATTAVTGPSMAPTLPLRPETATSPGPDVTRSWLNVLPVDTADNYDPSAPLDPFGTPQRDTAAELEAAAAAYQQLHSRLNQARRVMAEREREREREPDVAGAPPRGRPFSLARPPFRAAWGWDEQGQPYLNQSQASGAAEHPIPVPSTTLSARATASDRPAAEERRRNPEERGEAMSASRFVRLYSGGAHGSAFTQPFEDVLAERSNALAERTNALADARWRQAYESQMRDALARLTTAAAADGGDPVDLSDANVRFARRAPPQAHPAAYAGFPAPPHHHHHPPPPVDAGAGGVGEGDWTASETERVQRIQLAAQLSRQRAMQARNMRNVAAATASGGPLRALDDDDRMMRLVLHGMSRYPGGAPLALDSLMSGGRAKLKLHAGLSVAERTKVLVAIARGLFLLPPHQRRKLSQSVLSKGRWDAAALEGDKDESCAICQDDYIPEASVSVTPCNHMYHASCLDSWIKTPAASTCPMCRRDLAVFAVATNICPEGSSTARSIWMDTPADTLAVREAF